MTFFLCIEESSFGTFNTISIFKAFAERVDCLAISLDTLFFSIERIAWIAAFAYSIRNIKVLASHRDQLAFSEIIEVISFRTFNTGIVFEFRTPSISSYRGFFSTLIFVIQFISRVAIFTHLFLDVVFSTSWGNEYAFVVFKVVAN